MITPVVVELRRNGTWVRDRRPPVIVHALPRSDVTWRTDRHATDAGDGRVDRTLRRSFGQAPS
jgi:hypothetical protein